ncbi:hypothetical protein [Rhodovulum visakhapatnamense]|uniref:D12 class N6 adenine-specific DNA methyltransferase n=1 Tax=Rhodovulum visakhapatnamense TaxID=364297 RepID=A0A4R8F334_9RHOB|nr:hypothetical protein EV657_1563 [Rhodovulum visakhapatnamense]
MRFQITSRREFERLRACDPATLTDLEHAARFLYLQRLAFGGRPSDVFGVQPGCGSRFSLAKVGPLFDSAHSRLDGVVFENLPWQEVLARYDGPQALFYLDPPYWGGEDDYGKGLFDRASTPSRLDFGSLGGELPFGTVPERRPSFQSGPSANRRAV